MARRVTKNICQKHTCYNEIGLCAHNMDIVLCSIVNTYLIRLVQTISFPFPLPLHSKRWLHLTYLYGPYYVGTHLHWIYWNMVPIWTPIMEHYMARMDANHTWVTMRLDYVLRKMLIIEGSLSTIQLGEHMWSFEDKGVSIIEHNEMTTRKACGPFVVIILYGTPIFGWWIAS